MRFNRLPFTLLVLFFNIAVAVDSGAQTTRAEVAQQERAAKAKEGGEHQRSAIERFLFKLEDELLIERALNPPRGFHARLGGVGEGSGLGLGPAFRYNTDRFDVRTSAAASIKGYYVAEGAVRFPGTLHDSLYVRPTQPFVEVAVKRRDFPQEDFFGLGPESSEDARSNYAIRETTVRTTGGFRTRLFESGVSYSHLAPSIGEGTDDRMPTSQALFSPFQVPGITQRFTFNVVEGYAELRTIDRPLNKLSGGIYRARIGRYAERDDDQFSFARWDVDLRQYLSFVNDTRTIALRAWAASTDPDAGAEVPFFLQPVLGGATTLRGFRSFRFRDRSALLLQAEYRWRINEFVSGAFFYDTGAVARSLGDISSLERDYGVGLRAGSRTAISARLDVAFGGREGTRFLLRFDDVF